jgi:hypothetical protein
MKEKHLGKIRKFNRAILNPIMKLFAGNFFYSLVFHIGRRSKKEYSTPVVATVKDGYIYIPLPYGVDTDWLLNIQASGECKVKNSGKLYVANDPGVIDAPTALPAFSPRFRNSFQRFGVGQFLRLKIV